MRLKSMHHEALDEMRRLIETHLDPHGTLQVLDVGSLDVGGGDGIGSFRPLFARAGWHYTGLDMVAGANVDRVVRHGWRWPLRSRRFDLVISGQALEHAPRFWETWREMVRVTRAGGLLFLIVPAKGLEHRCPVDCWRFYPDAMRALAELEGLELLEASTRWANVWGDTIGVFRRPRRPLRWPWAFLRERLRDAAGTVLGYWLGHGRPAPAAATVAPGEPTAGDGSAEQQVELAAAPYRERFNRSLAEWFSYFQRDMIFDQVRWMGVKALKNPMDCWVYQQLLAELRPRVVVELGSAHGGSTLFLLNMLDLLGEGVVVSVDRDRRTFALDHPRLRRVDGDLADPAVIEQVSALCAGDGPVLVVHDADHHRDAVLRDLRNFAPLVTVGSWFIVEDGIVDVLPELPGVPPGIAGPFAAVVAFLDESPEFEIDRSREGCVMTCNPGGFLRRVQPAGTGA
jgi:cephalosporin hydroxylase